ncbi:MAG: heat-inducible transcriptional repressor HrcA [Actinobacteria bacterium]|nr:heat-inducible transcriptional repressor HrcA [Actinomycetota bacterium]
MSDERRLMVLRAIVEDFVATKEPVGSKALVERHDLGVSSATVRNDMASLEDEGYIVQPHTSAGRVPTDKGYRMFVDRLASIRPLSEVERRAIRAYLDEAADLDNVVDRTVRVLSQLTRQVAMVQYPSLGRGLVRHVELVQMGPDRVLVIMIADSGQVDQRVVELPADVDAAVLSEWRARINTVVHDQPFKTLASALVDVAEQLPPAQRETFAAVCDALSGFALEHVDQRVVIAGAANLARHDIELNASLHDVLEALEEHVTLLRLLGEETVSEQIAVRIGQENEVAGMNTISVVTSGYGAEGEAIGHLGVVGPTRMDYASNMAKVLAVARYLGRLIDS